LLCFSQDSHKHRCAPSLELFLRCAPSLTPLARSQLDPRLAMSDRLDDDALLLILDELATPSSDYDVYCAAKKALRNICIASRRLRRLAQPLLWRQIWVVEQSQADKVKSSPIVSSLGQGTRWLSVAKLESGGMLPQALKMAHVLPSVEKLLLSGPWRPGSLARIESFSSASSPPLSSLSRRRRARG